MTENKSTTIHAEVLISSGTTQQIIDYKIENVTQWCSYGSGYEIIRF